MVVRENYKAYSEKGMKYLMKDNLKIVARIGAYGLVIGGSMELGTRIVRTIYSKLEARRITKKFNKLLKEMDKFREESKGRKKRR